MKSIKYKAEIFVAGSVMMAATGQILIKLGLTEGTPLAVSFIGTSISNGLVLGMFVYGMGTLLWLFAVSREKISYVYPLAASNYVLLGVAGHVLLHESMSAIRWAGIAVMGIGISLLSTGSRKVAEA